MEISSPFSGLTALDQESYDNVEDILGNLNLVRELIIQDSRLDTSENQFQSLYFESCKNSTLYLHYL
jgi:hypothetical protein